MGEILKNCVQCGSAFLQIESLSICNDIHVVMNKMILKVEKKLTIVHMFQ